MNNRDMLSAANVRIEKIVQGETNRQKRKNEFHNRFIDTFEQEYTDGNSAAVISFLIIVEALKPAEEV